MRNLVFSAALLLLIGLARAQSDFHAHDHHHDSADHSMPGILGDYSMSREASGTSWHPDSTPMPGVHWDCDDWMLMAHGQATLHFTHGSGGRGDDKAFSTNMFML